MASHRGDLHRQSHRAGGGHGLDTGLRIGIGIGGSASLVRDLAATLAALPMAIGALLRHPAPAALSTVMLPAVAPGLLRTSTRGLQATVSYAMPCHALNALVGQASDNAFPLQQPLSIAQSSAWVVFRPCTTAALAILVTHRRDL